MFPLMHDGSALDVLKTRSLASVLEREIERMILASEIPPGGRVNENQLAARFGTSRGPIREAIRALEGAGMVETIPNRGTFLRHLSIKEAREVYDVRAALFGLAGRQLAERATPDVVSRLDEYLELMEQAAANQDFETYYPLNIGFHELILDSCGNATLAREYKSLVKRLTLFRARSLVQGGGLTVSNREHRAMVEAIRVHDSQWAHEAHWLHVSNAKNRLLAAVRAETENAPKEP